MAMNKAKQEEYGTALRKLDLSLDSPHHSEIEKNRRPTETANRTCFDQVRIYLSEFFGLNLFFNEASDISYSHDWNVSATPVVMTKESCDEYLIAESHLLLEQNFFSRAKG